MGSSPKIEHRDCCNSHRDLQDVYFVWTVTTGPRRWRAFEATYLKVIGTALRQQR